MSTLKEIGMRIKQRREEIEMSQDELSNILGYKDHSTISKIESGQRDFPRKKLMEIAVALRTSPAYLMGWEIDNSKESDSVEHLLAYYNLMNDLGRKQLEIQAKMIASTPDFQKKEGTAPNDADS